MTHDSPSLCSLSPSSAYLFVNNANGISHMFLVMAPFILCVLGFPMFLMFPLFLIFLILIII
jgi:hypothetical protein